MVKHSAPAGNRFKGDVGFLSVCVISRNVAMLETEHTVSIRPDHFEDGQLLGK
jgi:hypothetical protein